MQHQQQRWTWTKRMATLAVAVGLTGMGTAKGELRHWTGAGADNNWSTTDNWNPTGLPAGNDVVFGQTDTTTKGVVNNIVPADTTINSLSYTNAGSTAYHVTQIGAGTTLTVEADASTPIAVRVGDPYYPNVNIVQCYASMVGGGALVVDAPDSQVLVTKRTSADEGRAYWDLSGLGSCTIAAESFLIGRYDRGTGHVWLPTNGLGTATITAERLGVGDSVGGANGDSCTMTLGWTNVLHVNRIGIGAPCFAGVATNQNRGTLQYAAGTSGAKTTIRGRTGGTSRTDLALGSHGSRDATRTISGVAAFTNGVVDAMIGVLLAGDGRGISGSGGSGTAIGTFLMTDGNVDAEKVILGRTTSSGTPPTGSASGTLDVMGGTFAAGWVSMATNSTSARQNTLGTLKVSGSGRVGIAGPVILGSRSGAATNIVATVEVAGGSMSVLGDMAPGANPTGVVSVVRLKGGSLAVTNAAENAALRIERGTLDIVAGSALIDRLVTTNELCTTTVELRGTGAGDFGQVTVNDEVRLGGALTVTLANGYEPTVGATWTVVGGTGTRTGTFATASLPEGLKVAYTDNGYQLVYPFAGTVILVR